MDLKQTNLEQLCHDYFDLAPARAGADVISSLSDDVLEKTLASHWLMEPAARDVERRDAVDYFLGFTSILEVGSLAGCLPEDMVSSARAQIWFELLNRAPVKRYYVNFYPLALPQLFRSRLASKSQESAVEKFEEFARFLELSDRRANDSVETFLWMVDDGVTRDGFSLRDVLATFADRQGFVSAMAQHPDERTGMHLGLQGLLEFMAFSRDLERLLEDCEAHPILQSAFWHHHGYWYRQMGPSLVGIIGAVIERYRNDVGSVSESSDEPNVAKTHQDMDAAHRSMRRLVSGLYSVPIDEMLLTDKRPLPKPLHAPALPTLSPARRVSPLPWPSALAQPGSQLAAAAAADARPGDVDAAAAPAPSDPSQSDKEE
jgi:hypothetical protein